MTPEQPSRSIPSLSLDEVIADAVKGKSLLPNTDSIPHNAPIKIVLPDNHLPMGFVPQSPMFSSNIVAMNMASSQPVSHYLPAPGDPGPSRASVDNQVQGQTQAPSPKPQAISYEGYGGYSSPAPLNRPISLFSTSED